ncbi:MAG: PLP-dependent aminotransferase family protein [Alphaproteobacteria bacterium]|nr:PLP-dependent aminotransferase family protein [Alphaproteobacteria bacterium]
MEWVMAQRADRLNPSTIREILKVTERPGIISMAGGLPSADTFPVSAMAEASARILRDNSREALQYAASEGFPPLREWVAEMMNKQGLNVTPGQVLITTGSQQGLDLVGKVLIDPGSRVAIESPTYLGALQAFNPYEADYVAVNCDDDGPVPETLAEAKGARFMYLQPNYQNPSGRCLSPARRNALAEQFLALKLPVVEDNPYGDLWYDAPPPPPVCAQLGKAAIYLGSFSKILAPGLRLGYVIAPEALYPKLLQAKQAADLHTPSFNQRLVYETIKDGFLNQHIPTIRARYKVQRDAMQQALTKELGDFPGGGCHWQMPIGGMFFWLTLPKQLDAVSLLPRAVEAGVAYVPGAPFFAHSPQTNTLRLSFVTVSPERIAEGVAALVKVLRAAMN